MYTPLSEQLRPKTFSQIYGQPHLVGEKGLLTKIISAKKPLSILLYGPPGSGKTSIAKLYANAFDLELIHILPQASGTQEIKQHLAQNEKHPLFAASIMLFIDEIHRFNKQQQDLFLPFLEDGSIILVAATTENPSFALNKALLSRLRVLQLHPLSSDSLEQVLEDFLTSSHLKPSSEAKEAIIEHAGGDARKLLNTLDSMAAIFDGEVSLSELNDLSLIKIPFYDRAGDGHYLLISALHKAIRGSDVDASLYWLARMMIGGEDRDFIARRLTRIASEDVGLADPQAIDLVISCWNACERLGIPEGDLALAQATIYLALAPKSNAGYIAFDKAKKAAEKSSHLLPKAHFKNKKEIWDEREEEYIYDHDTPHGFSGQDYLPNGVSLEKLYTPIERGFERELAKRMAYFAHLKEKLKKEKNPRALE